MPSGNTVWSQADLCLGHKPKPFPTQAKPPHATSLDTPPGLFLLKPRLPIVADSLQSAPLALATPPHSAALFQMLGLWPRSQPQLPLCLFPSLPESCLGSFLLFLSPWGPLVTPQDHAQPVGATPRRVAFLSPARTASTCLSSPATSLGSGYALSPSCQSHASWVVCGHPRGLLLRLSSTSWPRPRASSPSSLLGLLFVFGPGHASCPLLSRATSRFSDSQFPPLAKPVRASQPLVSAS